MRPPRNWRLERGGSGEPVSCTRRRGIVVAGRRYGRCTSEDENRGGDQADLKFPVEVGEQERSPPRRTRGSFGALGAFLTIKLSPYFRLVWTVREKSAVNYCP